MTSAFTDGATLLVISVAAATLGLAAGSFLNVVIVRVSVGESLLRASHCRCGATLRWYDTIPVVSWLLLRATARCCGAPISVQYPLVETATAAVWVGVVWWMWIPDPTGAIAVETVTFLYLASASIALAVIDVRVHRLPDAIVLSSYLAVAAGFGVSAALSGGLTRLGAAAIGAVVMGGVYVVIAIINPGGMGAGDVKLAGVLGAALGWLGWAELGLGLFAGFLFGGLWGFAIIALKRGSRKTAIPFGPFMLGGAWLAAVAAHPILEGYARIYGLG